MLRLEPEHLSPTENQDGNEQSLFFIGDIGDIGETSSKCLEVFIVMSSFFGM